jgi:hypothetical protein
MSIAGLSIRLAAQAFFRIVLTGQSAPRMNFKAAAERAAFDRIGQLIRDIRLVIEEKPANGGLPRAVAARQAAPS